MPTNYIRDLGPAKWASAVILRSSNVQSPNVRFGSFSMTSRSFVPVDVCFRPESGLAAGPNQDQTVLRLVIARDSSFKTGTSNHALRTHRR
jgi:hypothetical protein